MDVFKARLTDAITRRFYTSAAGQELAEAAVEEIMGLVRDAIEKPTVSPLIDTWLVRTALGKQGTRVAATQIRPCDPEDPKTFDRNVEIFARIYDIERQCGALSNEATERAHKVVESMTRIGVINGPQ